MNSAREVSTAVVRNNNFLLVWLGEAVSLAGDQFYVVALPWLALALGGGALSLSMGSRRPRYPGRC